MRNLDEIFNIYLDEVSAYKRRKTYIDRSFCLNEDSIVESIQRTKEMYIADLPDIELSRDEQYALIKKIKSIYEVYQEEGCAILGDYEHNYKWHEELISQDNFEAYFWNRYKNHLLKDKHFPEKIVNTLEDKTLKSLMSYLGNPNDTDSRFSIRGLVVGDVQSGKTSNYMGLISRAADAGYKVIFILTGTIESLRKQTQIRVEEGFVGYDSVNGVDVGVGRGDKTPKAFTSREKDFTGTDDQNTTYRISDYSTEPMIFVVKKNTNVLKKIYTSLKKINTMSAHDKIDYPMLIIDDEADNASINTNKPEDDPTKINGHIRSILNLFTRTSYVGFTATPFANVFISYDDEDEMLKDDLFPRDFIYALEAPSNYQGSRKYFFEPNNNVRFIDDMDEQLFPMKHKKEWYGEKLFDSFYHAINTFILVNAIRDYRDLDKNTDRSMLINMSRFTNVQGVIRDITVDYFDRMKKDLKQTSKYSLDYALTNNSIHLLKESYDKEFSNIKHNGVILTFNDIFPIIYESIKNVKIVVVNSSKTSDKLKYEDKNGTRVIAIGGLALSRGLTLEGLCVSYFYRNSATFDVLMQMGRWFGYRENYADICKIFMTKASAEYYKEICRSIECLKNDIKTMSEQKKKPKDYGIRVRNDSIELGITASNKMRNTKSKVDRKSYYGNIFETPYLHRDLSIMESNITSTLEFIKHIDTSKKDLSVYQHPYFRDIDKKEIINLLNTLQIHDANENFDIKQINTFLQKQDKELDSFDVLIIGGSSEKRIIINEQNINIPMVLRNYDVPSNNVIRMSAKRAHLWGRFDTKFGLNEKELQNINENTRAQDYLIKGRNPILIIYFIDPQNKNNLDNYDYKYGPTEEYKLNRELGTKKYNYLVGYAIGFPSKDGAISETALYVVNKTVNYYEKDHEIIEEDGNE